MKTTVRVVRVFADETGAFGNELGVVFDAAGLPSELGVRLTAHLGFSETVFVDDLERAELRIFTPARELPLAGHPLVGTAHVLAEVTGRVPEVLRPRLADPVDTWQDGGLSWIRANTAYAPEFGFTKLDSPAAVEALAPDPAQYPHDQFWAWIDEPAGLLRARTFVASMGMGEDEATGSAAMLQARAHGRELTIRQGRGSVIRVRPAAREGWSEVGGRVVGEPERIVEL
ncbi:PhzF family phenazine biosynthesis protein [Actinospica durhamensis]|uniref:PhzF family phenazine biosynthesis protein n=1 Tax=Actinospica durhamensis TaxID=1508375 RepID=A0A941IQC4_9ACTN|nr:PhzF family phenazine biosynthesis protein [Actinospica durhamensis]MBR7837495.1 PhzF family phenazine biosynthesis protein [Actinospica durhamensis]